MHQPLHGKNFHKSVDEGLGSMVAINNHSDGASQHAANKQVHGSISETCPGGHFKFNKSFEGENFVVVVDFQ